MDYTWPADWLELQERARIVARKGVERFGSYDDSWINGYSKEFSKVLAAEGWLGMTWPVEYGGGGNDCR